MHLFTIATVTVHICTIPVDLLSIILYFFSLLSLALLDSLSPTLQCQEAGHHNNPVSLTATTATQYHQPPSQQHEHTTKSSKSF